VKDEQGGPAYGRTDWRRFALAVAVPTVVTGAIVLGIANGAIAAQFAVSGQPFKISADRLDGEGFSQYGNAVKNKDGKLIPVATSGIAQATLTNLCQSVHPKNSPISLVITAGTGDIPATATDMLIDMTELSGDATFTKINIGQDASTLKAGGPDAHGQPEAFGQQAERVVIDGLRQTALATTAGSFKLTNLSLKLDISSAGTPKECF
jgi:hypothetical protein